MGKRKEDVCPGCSRHCPLSHVRCKYGEKYIEKLRRTQEAAPDAAKEGGKSRKRRKWEKHVSSDTTVWKLLWTDSLLKRALRKGKIIEQQIHLALSDEEEAQLRILLEKITRIIP